MVSPLVLRCSYVGCMFNAGGVAYDVFIAKVQLGI